jgi:hypothetical protein
MPATHSISTQLQSSMLGVVKFSVQGGVAADLADHRLVLGSGLTPRREKDIFDFVAQPVWTRRPNPANSAAVG